MDSMKHYSTYQSQFIEMFGDTPERVELSSLCDTFIDGDWIEAKDQAEDGIRLIQTGNVGVGVFKDKGDKARYISEDTFERLNCTEVKNGDILVSRLPDPVGRACIIPGGLGKTITAVDCTIIRLADKIVPKFFIAFTNTPDYAMQIKKVLSGTTRLRVSRANLGKIHVPLPAIQKQIEFVSIAEQADKSKFTSLKSQFIEMFGTLGNPKGKIESLGTLCNIQRGGSPRPISEYITDQSDGLNWIKIGDTDDSMYITKTEEKIKPSGLRKTRQVYAGDLLLSNSMSFGRPYILKIDGCIHDGWLVLHINDATKLSPIYLCSYLSQQGTYSEMAKLAAGGVVQNLNSNIIKQLAVIVPNMEEQTKYIQILEQADKSKYIN